MMSTGLFSRPCLYAFRALTYLAVQPPGKLSGMRQIAEHEAIPNPFLGKVLLQLRRGRLLRSYRGIKGGYELALDPDSISLLTIVRCVDGNAVFDDCILEDRECTGIRRCSLHESWDAVRQQLLSFLKNKTVGDLVRTRTHVLKEAQEYLTASEQVSLPGK